MVSRAVVQLVDDSVKMQLLQVGILTDEVRGGLERFQDYGFTSVPLEGAEGVALFVGGRRDHGIAIAVGDRRYRVRNLESGEVAVYDHTGSKIVFKASGDIQIIPSSGDVTLTGDLAVSGTVTATVDVVGGGKSLKDHTHPAGTYAAPQDAGPVTGSSGGPA
jgi:phage gp45-like